LSSLSKIYKEPMMSLLSSITSRWQRESKREGDRESERERREERQTFEPIQGQP
jgi:hypothetical protein